MNNRKFGFSVCWAKDRLVAPKATDALTSNLFILCSSFIYFFGCLGNTKFEFAHFSHSATNLVSTSGCCSARLLRSVRSLTTSYNSHSFPFRRGLLSSFPSGSLYCSDVPNTYIHAESLLSSEWQGKGCYLLMDVFCFHRDKFPDRRLLSLPE